MVTVLLLGDNLCKKQEGREFTHSCLFHNILKEDGQKGGLLK